MSKILGNTVSVDEIIQKYGADTLRVFILSVTEPKKDMECSEEGIDKIQKFLSRYFKYCIELINTTTGNTIERQENKKKKRKFSVKYMKYYMQ